MELITLYKDNNNEVKMFDFAIKQLEDFVNSVNTLTALEQEEILALILDKISKQTSLKEKKIITTSKVPILNRG